MNLYFKSTDEWSCLALYHAHHNILSMPPLQPLTSVPHQSAGELENDEHTAAVIMQMVRTASRFRLSGSAEPPFKRMSGNKTHTHSSVQVGVSPGLTCGLVSFPLSDPGGLCLRSDSFWSKSFCGQTSEQPARTNQRLEAGPQDVRWQ